MSEISSIAVYCGSSSGTDPSYVEVASAFGAVLAENSIRLVYGGGEVGLMGTIADSVMQNGGQVLGVIPKGLFSRELKHTGLTELIETSSMHERKQIMADEADAFVAMPGGLGTLEELAEVATWAQLGIHNKPIAVLDINEFWTPFMQFIDGAISAGFIKEVNRSIIAKIDKVEDVIPILRAYDVPYVDKWLDN